MDQKIVKVAAAAGTTAVNAIVEHVKQRPYSVIVAANLLLTPVFGLGWMFSPILKVIGFGSLGPVAGQSSTSAFGINTLQYSSCSRIGSWAAAWQATYGGYVPAASFFSTLQYLGMVL